MSKTPGQIIGPVDWEIENVRGYVVCPGIALHTTLTKQRDTMLFLDRVPTIFCLHTACKPLICAANAALRAALRSSGEWNPPPLDAAAKAKLTHASELERQHRRLALARADVLAAYAWSPAQIRADSPVPTATLTCADFLAALFAPDDVVWFGEPRDSGGWNNTGNFREVRRWRTLAGTPAPFTCANTFKPGGFARTKDNLAERRHMVVECDSLSPHPETNRALSGAVFKYVLTVRPELHLRAVIDSGNKSLHAWFDYTPAAYDWAVAVLPALGVDAATLRLAQPVRAPGWTRVETGRSQALLYLNSAT